MRASALRFDAADANPLVLLMQEHVARSGVQRFAENLDLTRLPLAADTRRSSGRWS